MTGAGVQTDFVSVSGTPSARGAPDTVFVSGIPSAHDSETRAAPGRTWSGIPSAPCCSVGPGSSSGSGISLRPLTPRPDLRQVESIPRAQLRSLWSVRVVEPTSDFLRMRAGGNSGNISAENDTCIAFKKGEGAPNAPHDCVWGGTLPRQTGRVILLVKAQVEFLPRALNPGSPSRRVEFRPGARHRGCRVVSRREIKMFLCLRAGGSDGPMYPRMPQTRTTETLPTPFWQDKLLETLFRSCCRGYFP